MLFRTIEAGKNGEMPFCFYMVLGGHEYGKMGTTSTTFSRHSIRTLAGTISLTKGPQRRHYEPSA